MRTLPSDITVDSIPRQTIGICLWWHVGFKGGSQDALTPPDFSAPEMTSRWLSLSSSMFIPFMELDYTHKEFHHG